MSWLRLTANEECVAGEHGAMARSRGDILAVFATDDRKRIALEDLGVAASMVVVASCR
jgi:hypothetical protein